MSVVRQLVLACMACLLAFGCDSGPASSAPSHAPTGAESLREQPVVRVAAASDLTRAFEALGRRFEAQSQQKVVFAFGSTGLLAKQIREGAPFDLFAAANVSFVTDLVKAGACDGASEAPYARGRIVVWSKSGLVQPAKALTDLTDGRFKRIALANPEHAPYGKAAKEALDKLGLFKTLEPRIVYGENVKQTLQFAESGNAEAAIVALSLVIGTHGGSYFTIDDELHAPIDQSFVVCLGGKNTRGGSAFARFVNSATGRSVMRQYGFLLPGETLVRAP